MMRRSRWNYWSNSKLARSIIPLKKPEAATNEEWIKFFDDFKKEAPIRHWIVEVLFDKLQDIVNFPLDLLYHIKCLFLNRFISKTHCLTSTSINRGYWYDLDERILRCVFEEFAEYYRRTERTSKELDALYIWWTSERPGRPYYQETSYDENTQKLIELISLRGQLWD